MSEKELNILATQIIHNIFNQYQIQLNYHLDLINIQIQNNYNIYESNFSLEFLNILLISNFRIDEMIKFINGLINKSNINIEKNKNYLKLILFSNNNVELILNKKNRISNELFEKIINQIKEIKDENKKLIYRIDLIEKKMKS